MPSSKTPLEQFDRFEMLVFRVIQDRAIKGVPSVRPDTDEITAAARQLILAELEALRSQVDHNGTARSLSVKKLDEAIKQYKPSLFELPESEQQAIYEKTAKESTKLQQDLIKQYNGGGDEFTK